MSTNDPWSDWDNESEDIVETPSPDLTPEERQQLAIADAEEIFKARQSAHEAEDEEVNSAEYLATIGVTLGVDTNIAELFDQLANAGGQPTPRSYDQVPHILNAFFDMLPEPASSDLWSNRLTRSQLAVRASIVESFMLRCMGPHSPFARLRTEIGSDEVIKVWIAIIISMTMLGEQELTQHGDF